MAPRRRRRRSPTGSTAIPWSRPRARLRIAQEVCHQTPRGPPGPRWRSAHRRAWTTEPATRCTHLRRRLPRENPARRPRAPAPRRPAHARRVVPSLPGSLRVSHSHRAARARVTASRLSGGDAPHARAWARGRTRTPRLGEGPACREQVTGEAAGFLAQFLLSPGLCKHAREADSGQER